MACNDYSNRLDGESMLVILDEASIASEIRHPDDGSNASGRTGFWPPDSLARAKPVPVSEIAQRSFLSRRGHCE
jgi:hypothetical protein